MKKYFKSFLFIGLLAIGLVLTGCNFGDVKSGEVTLKSLRTTKDTISFDLAVSGDTDTIGLITAALYQDEIFISSIEDIAQDQLTGHTFIDLTPFTDYRLEISYTTGSKNEPIVINKDVKTYPHEISVSSIRQKDDVDVYVGDNVAFIIEFNNIDEVKIETITINGDKIDVSKDNVIHSVEVILPCDFIDDTWDIVVTNVSVKVNNAPIEYKIEEDNTLTLQVKGVLTITDFMLKDDISYIEQNKDLALKFSVIGEHYNLYEVDSVEINAVNYTKEQLQIDDRDIIVNISLDKEGVNTIKLTKVTFVKDGVSIEAPVSEEIEIYVSSSSEIISINNIEEFLAIEADTYRMYSLNTDLDFTGFNSIIPEFGDFKGHFNGNHYRLKNITLSSGLFNVNDGVIINLIIDNPTLTLNMTKDKQSYGILVNQNEGLLRNININNASINISDTLTNSFVGGVTGTNKGQVVDSSYLGNIIDLGVNNSIGGIAGYNEEDLLGLISALNIESYEGIGGGIVGSYSENSSMENSHYFIGQLVTAKHLNELGDAYTYENMIDINWYKNTLEWKDFSLSYLDLNKYSNIYELGSKGNPIIIDSVMDLQNIGEFGYYVLTTDLDYTGLTLIPVTKFSGVLDGNGHIIKGINIKTSELESIGLFNTLNGMVINLKIIDSSIEITSDKATSVGFIAGRAFNAVIDNVIIDSSCSIVISKTNITNDKVNSYVGALIGYGHKVVIYNSASSMQSNVVIDASNHYTHAVIGGLVGYLKEGSLENVATNANLTINVTGNNASIVYVGGVVGFNEDTLLVSVYAQGSINLTSNATKSFAGAVYGDNTYYGHENIHALDTQVVMKNGIEVPHNSKTNNYVLFISIVEINEYNSSKPWGIL